MTNKIIGNYQKKLITRDKFIKKVLKSYRKQLNSLLPEKAYELEFEDLLEQITSLLTGK